MKGCGTQVKPGVVLAATQYSEYEMIEGTNGNQNRTFEARGAFQCILTSDRSKRLKVLDPEMACVFYRRT